MKRMSPGFRAVSMPTRSPGRSSTGPDVTRMSTPSSRAISIASVVLPRPGGPKNSAWSRGSLRCFAASIAICSDSFTFAWPTNSSSRDGRSAASLTRSSGSTSGVVISERMTLRGLGPPAHRPRLGFDLVARMAGVTLVLGARRRGGHEPPVGRPAARADPLRRRHRGRHLSVRSCNARRTSASASRTLAPSPASARRSALSASAVE